MKKTDFTRQVITRTLWKINKRRSVCERMLVDSRVDAKPGGTRMRAGGEVKGKEANGVGSH